MLNSKSFLAFSLLIFCCFSACVQRLSAELAGEPIGSASSGKPTVNRQLSIDSAVLMSPAVEPEQLLSSSVAQRFYEIAYELANSKDTGPSEAEQAIVFLNAAMNLDSGANNVRPLLIKLASRYSKPDHAELVYYSLEDYVNETADLEVVREAIRYLLEQLNTREEREILLKGMLISLGGKNTVLHSELATLLGLLMAEKPDLKTAQFYLAHAYSSNKYNRLALAKLVELMPEQIGPAIYLDHLRLILREDPSNIDVALAFAQYVERLEIYETAAKAYEYCANLFRYLYPSETLPANIYIPWVISCYNTQQSQHRCLQIASELRQEGQFDLLLEAIAGRAATKIGNAEEATRIFQAAEGKARQLLKQGPGRDKEHLWTLDDSSSTGVGAKQFAWFYCFVLPDASKALDWANRAYATEPNSPTTSALLAYSLVMNQQTEWANPLLNNYRHNQIADLTLALIQLKQGQRDSAIGTLKSAIAKDPGSLVAEQARELLAHNGVRYVPPVDSDVILAALETTFGPTLVPAFVKPEDIISVQFDTRGNEFSYGSKINGIVAITNNSSEPLVISDDGLFKGNIRIDAEVRGGLKKKIPNLVSTRVGTALFVEPGRSIITPLQLATGELSRILLAHPQASLDIEFTLYLDPVTTAEGKITNRLTHIKPTKALVKRSGIELTSKYLQNRFDSISKGQPGQKIKTAQLFIGLLMEQQAMANRKPLYRYMYADWMPTMLRSALIHKSGLLRNPAEDEWAVKVHTMADMLSWPLDQELTSAVAENLNDARWPIRMMAIHLLAKSPGSKFSNVLNWTAKNDPNKLVRDVAIALGAAEPLVSQPTELPARSKPKTQLPTK